MLMSWILLEIRMETVHAVDGVLCNFRTIDSDSVVA